MRLAACTKWLNDPALTTMDHDRLVRRFTTGFYEFMSANQPIARAMVHLFVSSSTEGAIEHLRGQIAETLAPIITALQLRLLMLFVGVAATFLRGTYPTDDDVPDNEEIIDELARFISNGLRD